MPELPEVETIKRGLSEKIIGKKITDIDILNAKSFIGDKAKVLGVNIKDVSRRAKLVRIELSNSLNLVFHLKLTGQLVWRKKLSNINNQLSVNDQVSSKLEIQNADFAGGHPSHDWHKQLPNSNTRIIFSFDDGSKLFFNDMRKFGWCKVLTSAEIEAIYTKDYGLEPLDKAFTINYLLEKSKRIPNRTAKQFVMDQAIAAGMGNIYTDEALFEARILPTRKVKDITLGQWQKLIQSMQKVLALGIKHGGTTDSDYVNINGTKGGMQDYLKVYHRTGLDCLNECGGKVERMVIGGRGTHYCQNCQK